MCISGDIACNTRVKDTRTGQYGRVLKTTSILDATVPVGFANNGGKTSVPLCEIMLLDPDQREPADRKAILRAIRKQTSAYRNAEFPRELGDFFPH